MFNNIEDFKTKMLESGLTPPSEVFADGIIHRFATSHKRCDQAGWYVLQANGIPTGCFGDWRTGRFCSWSAKSKSEMSLSELREHREKIAKAKLQREEAQKTLHYEAKDRAHHIWKMAHKPSDHPYLIHKKISPYCAKQLDSSLILPIVNMAGEIQSLQYIYPNGDKKLLFGGAKKGNLIPVTQLESPTFIMICEGFATGATLAALYPDRCVIAAIDAGNLERVAVGASQRWPDAKILICADDDRLTPGNPGVTKARLAAIAAGADYTVPVWPKGAPMILTDFNDLACWLLSSQEDVA